MQVLSSQEKIYVNAMKRWLKPESFFKKDICKERYSGTIQISWYTMIEEVSLWCSRVKTKET